MAILLKGKVWVGITKKEKTRIGTWWNAKKGYLSFYYLYISAWADVTVWYAWQIALKYDISASHYECGLPIQACIIGKCQIAFAFRETWEEGEVQLYQ